MNKESSTEISAKRKWVYDFDTAGGLLSLADLILSSQADPKTLAEAESMFQRRQWDRGVVAISAAKFGYNNYDNITSLTKSWWNSGALGKAGVIGAGVATWTALVGFLFDWYKDNENYKNRLKQGEVITKGETPMTKEKLQEFAEQAKKMHEEGLEMKKKEREEKRAKRKDERDERIAKWEEERNINLGKSEDERNERIKKRKEEREERIAKLKEEIETKKMKRKEKREERKEKREEEREEMKAQEEKKRSETDEEMK